MEGHLLLYACHRHPIVHQLLSEVNQFLLVKIQYGQLIRPEERFHTSAMPPIPLLFLTCILFYFFSAA
jgi:hypothetical protein